MKAIEHNHETVFLLKDNYIVTLEQLHNNKMGHPRYKARIIDMRALRRFGDSIAYIFTFTTHFGGKKADAEDILEHYIKTFCPFNP